MKKCFIKLKASIRRGICNLLCHIKKTGHRAERVLANNTGEGYIDTALKVLMAVVIGVLILGGLYALFDDTLLPSLTRKISDLFNYAG